MNYGFKAIYMHVYVLEQTKNNFFCAYLCASMACTQLRTFRTNNIEYLYTFY